ncbi:hypothetical protein [Microbacterium sp. cf332]|uniref:hypothetical protein n=1 Tax=Microbacterium sp. cf332 TaxID=1761804 RepID=UPI00088093BA|nr:hypothetical protein [Microbacterium sp. cf332]SDQ17454.1 hypothetical protein SAMN04487847_0734 [Microbacterium sp. cf332]
MTVHPRLVRSVPFWILVIGSVAAIGGGAYILIEKLGHMETTILDNTATGVDVYVGQIWAVFGGILVGAGVVGLALALAVGALRSLVPAARVAETTTLDELDTPEAAAGPAVSHESPALDTEAVDTNATPTRSTPSTRDSPAAETTADVPQR